LGGPAPLSPWSNDNVANELVLRWRPSAQVASTGLAKNETDIGIAEIYVH